MSTSVSSKIVVVALRSANIEPRLIERLDMGIDEERAAYRRWQAECRASGEHKRAVFARLTQKVHDAIYLALQRGGLDGEYEVNFTNDSSSGDRMIAGVYVKRAGDQRGLWNFSVQGYSRPDMMTTIMIGGSLYSSPEPTDYHANEAIWDAEAVIARDVEQRPSNGSGEGGCAMLLLALASAMGALPTLPLWM